MVPLPVIEANRTELATLVSNNFLGQNTGAIATNEAEYLDMWIQDALTMDTYQVNSQAASALPAQTAAPQVASGAVPAAAAAATPASSSSSVITGLLGDFAQLFGVSAAPQALDAGSLVSWLGLVASGVSANPSAALLPVQATYYAGMLGSTPARMFMSSGSSASSSAGSTLASTSDTLMANVGKFVDDKLTNVMGGVGNQLRTWGSAISASLASGHHVGGLSVPNAWHGLAPEMSRAAPVLPATSVAAPQMTHGLPSSPFSQGLMGALAGRGMSTMGSKVAAKVMPRSPAGG
jgi:PPE-repeat protein